MADKAVIQALMEAMGAKGSRRPKMRPDGVRSSARPTMRPARTIGTDSRRQSQGIPPEENYSAEDLDRLLRGAKGMMGGGDVQKYKKGGAVKKKSAKKAKKGCVMKGRGGSYKGMK